MKSLKIQIEIKNCLTFIVSKTDLIFIWSHFSPTPQCQFEIFHFWPLLSIGSKVESSRFTPSLSSRGRVSMVAHRRRGTFLWTAGLFFKFFLLLSYVYLDFCVEMDRTGWAAPVPPGRYKAKWRYNSFELDYADHLLV